MSKRSSADKHMNRPVPLKKCPKCGRRFEVRRVEKAVEKEDEVVQEEKLYLAPGGMASAYPIPTSGENGAARIEVAEVIEEDHIAYTYRCSHCGNVWTERREKTKDLGEATSDGDI